VPPPVGQIELDEGTTSELALALRDALARNVDRSEGRRALEKYLVHMEALIKAVRD